MELVANIWGHSFATKIDVIRHKFQDAKEVAKIIWDGSRCDPSQISEPNIFATKSRCDPSQTSEAKRICDGK